VERETNGLTPQERIRARTERSRPLIIELEIWLREQHARVPKKSKIGKAIEHSFKRWTTLSKRPVNPPHLWALNFPQF